MRQRGADRLIRRAETRSVKAGERGLAFLAAARALPGNLRARPACLRQSDGDRLFPAGDLLARNHRCEAFRVFARASSFRPFPTPSCRTFDPRVSSPSIASCLVSGHVVSVRFPALEPPADCEQDQDAQCQGHQAAGGEAPVSAVRPERHRPDDRHNQQKEQKRDHMAPVASKQGIGRKIAKATAPN